MATDVVPGDGLPLGDLVGRLAAELADLARVVTAIQDQSSPLLDPAGPGGTGAGALAVFQNLDIAGQTLRALAAFLADLDLGAVRDARVRPGPATVDAPLRGLIQRLEGRPADAAPAGDVDLF